mmetsp:Transcript_18125/g.48276  ORF Transcript_18125/g.48276 Transcript_18125/m.48276 type:complete len:116 (+) Transcript_18125:336-683(+)
MPDNHGTLWLCQTRAGPRAALVLCRVQPPPCACRCTPRVMVRELLLAQHPDKPCCAEAKLVRALRALTSRESKGPGKHAAEHVARAGSRLYVRILKPEVRPSFESHPLGILGEFI